MSNVQAHWYDLNTEIKNIKHEVVQNSTDRHTKLLTKEKDFRLVLISMKKGAVLQEHSANGRIFVQVLEGHVQVKVNNEQINLPMGHLTTLEANVKHDVTSLEDSVFLLTISIQM
jgi:quercetin dioxygenase-like cupin family protein